MKKCEKPGRTGVFVITGLWRFQTAVWCALVLAVFGCEPPPSNLPAAATSPAETSVAANSGDEEPAGESTEVVHLAAAPAETEATSGGEQQAAPAAIETWDAHYIDEIKVGHAHTKVQQLEENGRQLVKKSGESVQNVKRFGQTITQRIAFVSVETPDGDVVRFEEQMSGGGADAVFKGVVDGNKLRLTVTTAGKSIEEKIDWNPNWQGFFAAEDSLRQNPLKPSETRRLRMFAPFLHQEGAIVLAARDYEMVELPLGAVKLLKVDASISVAGAEIKTTYWIDERGEALKSRDAQLNMITYRTTKEKALEKSGSAAFDLGHASAVRLKRPLANAHDMRRVVYRVRMKDGDPAKVFADGGAQQVKSIDENTAEIVVTAVARDAAELPAALNDPTPEDLAPSSLIQSDNARVVQLANSVAKDAVEPRETAVALEGFVRRSMKVRDFAPALASAADVAESLEGDCTEHAVLLAALCRARGIPARVAIGLVYYPKIDGFAYHMWNEVWLDGRWYPLDATLGRGGIGAAHLKIADSNLSGANRYSVFLPVAQVLGNLEIEVVEAE